MREKGSLSVEASIMIPIVFVVLLPFLYILRSVYLYDSIQSATIETAQLMQPLFYLTEKLPDEIGDIPETTEPDLDDLGSFQDLEGLLGRFGDGSGAKTLVWNLALQAAARYFTGRLLEDKQLERYGLSGGVEDLSFLLSDFMIENEEYGSLFRISVNYERDFPFARSFATLKPVWIHVLARKYTGRPTVGSAGAADGNENEEEQTYYRLRNGNHYHLGSCYMLDKDVKTISREAALKQGYSACPFCHPESLSQVVITGSGTRFHADWCYHIGGSVSIVTWQEIQEKGYLPCAICIGGGEWFASGN